MLDIAFNKRDKTLQHKSRARELAIVLHQLQAIVQVLLTSGIGSEDGEPLEGVTVGNGPQLNPEGEGVVGITLEFFLSGIGGRCCFFVGADPRRELCAAEGVSLAESVEYEDARSHCESDKEVCEAALCPRRVARVEELKSSEVVEELNSMEGPGDVEPKKFGLRGVLKFSGADGASTACVFNKGSVRAFKSAFFNF